MKTENADLAEKLAAVSKNLIFGEDGKISPFVWELEEKGVLSAYKIVMQNKIWEIPSLRVEDFEKFNQVASTYLREEYQTLFEISSSCLKDFEFYVGYFPDEIFVLFVGKITSNEWFGIGYGFKIDPCASFVGNFESSDNFQPKTIFPPSQAILEIISNLQQKGFYEAKLPTWEVMNSYLGGKQYIYQVAQQKEELIEKLLASVRFLVIQEFGEGIDALGSQFYDPEDDPKRDYKELDRVLKSKLTNLKFYMVGLTSVGEFNIYVIGNTSSGDYAGVRIDVPLNP